jgi:hypothetical protein
MIYCLRTLEDTIGILGRNDAHYEQFYTNQEKIQK